MLGAAPFSQVIVATDGSMARMTTISPNTFVQIKRKLSTSASRDPKKRVKDALQAVVVRQLMKEKMIELPGKLPNAGAPAPAGTGRLASSGATRAKRR